MLFSDFDIGKTKTYVWEGLTGRNCKSSISTVFKTHSLSYKLPVCLSNENAWRSRLTGTAAIARTAGADAGLRTWLSQLYVNDPLDHHSHPWEKYYPDSMLQVGKPTHAAVKWLALGLAPPGGRPRFAWTGLNVPMSPVSELRKPWSLLISYGLKSKWSSKGAPKNSSEVWNHNTWPSRCILQGWPCSPGAVPKAPLPPPLPCPSPMGKHVIMWKITEGGKEKRKGRAGRICKLLLFKMFAVTFSSVERSPKGKFCVWKAGILLADQRAFRCCLARIYKEGCKSHALRTQTMLSFISWKNMLRFDKTRTFQKFYYCC